MFPLKNVINETEVLKIVGISRSTLHRWRRAGLLPWFQVSRAVWYPVGAVEKLKAAKRFKATTGPLAE